MFVTPSIFYPVFGFFVLYSSSRQDRKFAMKYNIVQLVKRDLHTHFTLSDTCAQVHKMQIYCAHVLITPEQGKIGSLLSSKKLLSW